MELTNDDRAKFIGCEIIYREACYLAATTPLRVDVEFHPKGLHDLQTADMLARLQASVDAADASSAYEAILLGYARCNDGVVGLTARTVPLIIPKAHDCVTLFFGCRKAYREYFDGHPGAYYHTTGWLERNDSKIAGQDGVMSQLGLDLKWQEMVEKYGEDNAAYIRETMGDLTSNYSQICYLEMGVADETALIAQSRDIAEERCWKFEHRQGDLSLLRKLMTGPWTDDDFLIVPPGRSIAPRNDDEVLALAE